MFLLDELDGGLFHHLFSNLRFHPCIRVSWSFLFLQWCKNLEDSVVGSSEEVRLLEWGLSILRAMRIFWLVPANLQFGAECTD